LTIESLWAALRIEGKPARQRRVDATHPLDLYVDFEPPDRPGLLLVTAEKPPHLLTARSISLAIGHRADGRWSLRMTLEVPALLPVFTALCHDVVEATRSGVPDSRAASAFLGRIERWRRLLDKDASDLSGSAALGLIGELTVLLSVILPGLTPLDAVSSWTGPLGTPQDFILPSGQRLEVKAIDRHASTVRINGLTQLDPGADPLKLVVVRLETTAALAEGVMTLAGIVAVARELLADPPQALENFDRLLAFTGWSPARDPGTVAVRVSSIEGHVVNDEFPRLMPSLVHARITDASYVIRLPEPTERWAPHRWISMTSEPI
jgi:Putative  PD-(D/E)XK family member, (DUF4420)